MNILQKEMQKAQRRMKMNCQILYILQLTAVVAEAEREYCEIKTLQFQLD